MARFTAITSRGLGKVLEQELKDKKFKVLSTKGDNVIFEANWKEMYRAHLQIKIATRIILPVLDFPAYDAEELYNNILKHDFTKYIKPGQTLSVVSTLSDSLPFNNSHFISQRVKDAVVDQFMDKYNKRPSVDSKNPSLKIMVRLKNNACSVALDLTGRSLAYRGYREDGALAAMREHLAAGLIAHTGWQGEEVLIDPMCGSGTLLIEAACQLRARVKDRDFVFKHFINFDHDKYEELLNNPPIKRRDEPLLYGYDQDPRALEAARSNAKRAGVIDLIEFKQQSLNDLLVSVDNVPEGMVVMNPPYGKRIGHIEELAGTYKLIGDFIKKRPGHFKSWVLSGEPSLTQYLKLRSSMKIPVYNGDIDCRWICYQKKADS